MAAASESPTPQTVGFPVTPELLEAGQRARGRSLCSECFGRLFGRWGHGFSNPERAELLRTPLGVDGFPDASACSLCEGLFGRWETWVARCLAAGEGWEWERFLCGSRWDPELLAKEELLWTEVGTGWGESARGAFNRELGKRIERRTGKRATPDRPEVVFLADLPVGQVLITVHSLYVSGRYRKLDRTLPQTRWPCRKCHGRGCVTCGGTGKTYPTSVEELIAGPLLAVTSGTGSRFHGMGREDIDARMMGDGRPFVLEILRPRRRTVRLESIASEIHASANGRVEVLDLQRADSSSVAFVKEANPSKSYRVAVRGESSRDKVNEALAFVRGRAIAQRTPTRVAHRRSDRVRTRRILDARLVASDVGRFTLELEAEAGTYVKEWVEGDGGRTEPSLAQLLGVPLTVEELDVLEVHDRKE